MKRRTRSIFTTPGWDSSLSHGSPHPQHVFAGTYLYTWVERGTVKVKCLAQEHNTVPRPRLKLGPFDPESSAITAGPLRLPHPISVTQRSNAARVRSSCVIQLELFFHRTISLTISCKSLLTFESKDKSSRRRRPDVTSIFAFDRCENICTETFICTEKQVSLYKEVCLQWHVSFYWNLYNYISTRMCILCNAPVGY